MARRKRVRKDRVSVAKKQRCTTENSLLEPAASLKANEIQMKNGEEIKIPERLHFAQSTLAPDLHESIPEPEVASVVLPY